MSFSNTFLQKKKSVKELKLFKAAVYYSKDEMREVEQIEIT